MNKRKLPDKPLVCPTCGNRRRFMKVTVIRTYIDPTGHSDPSQGKASTREHYFVCTAPMDEETKRELRTGEGLYPPIRVEDDEVCGDLVAVV